MREESLQRAADAVAALVSRPVVRASADSFLQPRPLRYRRGRESPEGFYLDSIDLAKLGALLLAPFAAGEPFRRASLDVERDAPAHAPLEDAPHDAVLLLDGLFLHRPELRDRWDLSILLDVAPEVAAARLLQRDGKPTRHRYVRGMELYFAAAEPARHASLVLPS